ncbi:MAG: hypothetical protein IKV27_06955 [Lachnospiraceae bacterium]|nr:hypothetical protein [Lachnospiraceae bacterium]
MLKEAIEKIERMAAPTTVEIEGSVYSNQELVFVQDKKPMPKCIELTGLDSVCKMVRNEAEHVGLQIFIQVKDYRNVSVFTSLDSDEDRLYLYKCAADTPVVTTDRFMDYEKAVIELRSLYIPNDGTDYLLQLLSSISNESRVTSSDNGVTQRIEATNGIALSSMVTVKPRVTLQPFRTFIEVAQPASEFLLRINERGEIGFYQADGGVWKLEATRNVAAYFEEKLQDLIDSGTVVVIR